MPVPARPRARALALAAAALSLSLAAPAHAAAPPAPVQAPTVHVDALRWVDGTPRLETRTAAGSAAAARLVRTLDADPAVSDAQVRTTYQLTPTATSSLSPGRPGRRLLATDPFLRYAYHLSTVDAYGAWPTTTGTGVQVAVLDSGVDGTQPDLVGRVRQIGNFTREAGLVVEHGTEVATVLAGTYGNGVGAAGVAPDVTILAGKVCEKAGCSSDAVVAGITAAVQAGADVVNLSLGGPDYNRTTAAAVDWAVSQGVVVVASAGNSGDEGNPVEYPASYPGVVSVSASLRSGAAAPWAQHNAAVDLSAPGDAVLAGDPGKGGSYASVLATGTSFSAPQVAAAAALVRAVAPTAGAAAVEGWLRDTATRQSWPDGYGTGMLDVAAAVQAARTAQSAAPPVTTPPVTTPPATATPPGTPTVVRARRSLREVPVVVTP